LAKAVQPRARVTQSCDQRGLAGPNPLNNGLGGGGSHGPLSIAPLWLCAFRVEFGGLDGFHQLPVLLPQLQKFLYPLFESKAVKRRYAHTAVQPIGSLAGLKVEITVAPFEPRVEAAFRQFCADRFEREAHCNIISLGRRGYQIAGSALNLCPWNLI
jgi:hypothetical protein